MLYARTIIVTWKLFFLFFCQWRVESFQLPPHMLTKPLVQVNKWKSTTSNEVAPNPLMLNHTSVDREKITNIATLKRTKIRLKDFGIFTIAALGISIIFAVIFNLLKAHPTLIPFVLIFGTLHNIAFLIENIIIDPVYVTRTKSVIEDHDPSYITKMKSAMKQASIKWTRNSGNSSSMWDQLDTFKTKLTKRLFEMDPDGKYTIVYDPFGVGKKKALMEAINCKHGIIHIPITNLVHSSEDIAYRLFVKLLCALFAFHIL